MGTVNKDFYKNHKQHPSLKNNAAFGGLLLQFLGEMKL